MDFLVRTGPQNFFGHLNEMASRQLLADSFSPWPMEVACIESTVAANAIPVISSGHKEYGAQANKRDLLKNSMGIFIDSSTIKLQCIIGSLQARSRAGVQGPALDRVRLEREVPEAVRGRLEGRDHPLQPHQRPQTRWEKSDPVAALLTLAAKAGV